MASPIRLWQGTDRTIIVNHDYEDMPTATAIDVYIDSHPQVVKTLSDGVTGVTSTSFILTVSAGDTDAIQSGEYEIQAKITAGGSTLFGRIEPGTVKILDSVFTSTQ